MGIAKKILKEIYSRIVKRRVQEFNVENRAFELLDKGNLPRAPGYFTEEMALKKIFNELCPSSLKENPHLKEEVNRKKEKLVDNMGRLKITVKYPVEREKDKSKFPKDRQIIPKDTNFKVNKLPTGCIDFEIFLKIYDYKYNHLWTNEEIADEFDLNGQDVDDLLFYFKPFNNKIMDKKSMISNSNTRVNKTYIKIAEILGRDVETFEEIPIYKKELKRIEAENKQMEECEPEKEIETKEQELERYKNLKFKHKKFYISSTN